MSRKKKALEYNLFEEYEKMEEGNLFAETVVKAVTESAKDAKIKKSNKIEDFGEKIGGARKDLYAA